MRSIKEFLDSSSIHGLAYVSSSGRVALKFFWASVTLSGMSMAVFLINQAFISWRESPITSSIETMPISKAPFPKITVCPPKGSNTGLNHGLNLAENATLNSSAKNDLLNLVDNYFYDIYIKEEGALYQTEKYRNWYTGYTQVHLGSYNPFISENNNNPIFVDRNIETLTSTGTFITPYFGQKFSHLNYEPTVSYGLKLIKPKEIIENDSLVLKIDVELEIWN